MSNMTGPAEQLIGLSLNGGWKVIEKISPKPNSGNIHSSYYIVSRGHEKGFLKAFDYSELRKTGDKSIFKRISEKFERELQMLKKCQERNIETVVKLITSDSCFIGESSMVDNRVDYLILEYSENGSVYDCIENGHLDDFKAKFQALVQIFDGLEKLHENGIMHLDLKGENLMHFLKERITKITDFGSARRFVPIYDEDLKDDFNNILTTRHYAPPECLYDEEWTTNWTEYRRKIDLYLVGNIIVSMFTDNLSFTALLKKSISTFHHWGTPGTNGKYKQLLPYLIRGASTVYVLIEEEVRRRNEKRQVPLNDEQIDRLLLTISELCTPDAEKRGHPRELQRNNNRDGLDRYRDRFITLRNACN